MTKFHDLPEELTVRIFEHLHGKDLVSCSLACRLFYDIVQYTSVLQYHIELAIAGVEDKGLTSQLPIAERLSEIKTVRESWSTLRFRHRQSIPMPMNNVWELAGGFMACGIATEETRGLSFVQLPSVVRGTPGRSWEHRDMGVAIRDFTVDPTQDLAVLIVYPTDGVYMIHLRAMSSGRGHPGAADPALSCVPDNVRGCDFVIQVMGEFLAVLFHTSDQNGQDHIFLWNWRTGKLVTELQNNQTNKNRIDSFSFLSSRHFVVSRFPPEGRWAESVSKTPILEVYDFLHRPSDPLSSAPTLVRSFDFPVIVGYGVILTMLTRSNPSPECSPLPSDSGVPFGTASTARVMAVSLDIVKERHTFCTYVLFVHHSTLLDSIEDGQIPHESDVQVPWHKWGPQKSRMLQTLYNERVWVCYMHGTRYVRLHPQDEHSFAEGSRLRMLDFNPFALQRDDGEECVDIVVDAADDDDDWIEDMPEEVYSASHPTQIPADGVFEHDVLTTLPYREVYTNEVFYYNAVMIDEECLVGRPLSALGMGASEGFEFLCF